MLHCYIVMYDLRVPGRDYPSLYEALKSYPRWGKITESTWAIVTEIEDASVIRSHLLNYMDGNDRIMVIRSGGIAAWKNALADNNWLKTNLTLT